MPAIVPVRWFGYQQEQPVVEARGIVPVTAIVPVLSSIVHIPALKRDPLLIL